MFCTCATIKLRRALFSVGNDTHPNALVEVHFLFVVLVSVKRIEANAVVEEFRPNL